MLFVIQIDIKLKKIFNIKKYCLLEYSIFIFLDSSNLFHEFIRNIVNIVYISTNKINSIATLDRLF